MEAEGVVASLVIQLSSEHSGGALVGDEICSSDMILAGVMESPHTPRSTQLVLRYSLALPPEIIHLKDAKGDNPLSKELAKVLNNVEPDDECFTLLLPNEYTKEAMCKRGADALNGVYKTRFRALLEADSLVPENKIFSFYIAQLSRTTQDYDWRIGARKGLNWDEEYASWQECDCSDSVTWYSIDGKRFGGLVTTMFLSSAAKDTLESTLTPVFLNPGRQTLAQVWKTPHSKPYDGWTGDIIMKRVSGRYVALDKRHRLRAQIGQR